MWGGGVWLVEEGGRGRGRGDFFKPVKFFKIYPLNFIFEATGVFMKGQGRLKKIIQVAAVLKSGFWIAGWSFRFFFVAVYRVSGISKISLWVGKARHPKRRFVYGMIFSSLRKHNNQTN